MPGSPISAAARPRHYHHNHHQGRRILPPLLLLFITLSIILFLFTFSSPRSPLPISSNLAACDLADGEWIYDEGRTPRYDGGSCKEIYKGWNCGINGKENAREVVKWRWRPRGEGCDVKGVEARGFLEKHRGRSIVQDLLEIL